MVYTRSNMYAHSKNSRILPLLIVSHHFLRISNKDLLLMTPITAQRIMIFGKPGAGKSTFALKLHQKLGIPLYHLDAYFFTHYWTKRNYEEFMAIQHDLVTQDFWIIDGNCTRSLETRYQKADVCIYFNFSRSHCLRGIVKRFFS